MNSRLVVTRLPPVANGRPTRVSRTRLNPTVDFTHCSQLYRSRRLIDPPE